MIFSKEHDNALWCIINIDKKNHNQIIAFIHSLPSELIEQINQDITKRQSILEEYFLNEDMNNYIPNFTGTFELNPNVKYSYSLDIIFGDLKIIKVVNHDHIYEEKYCLHLEETPASLTSILEDGIVGMYSYTTNKKQSPPEFIQIDHQEFKYSIFKNIFGHTAICVAKNDQNISKTKKFLDLSKLPQDINLADFQIITKSLPVERLVELEKYLRNEIILDNLTIEDRAYLEQARKLPLKEFLKDREYYCHHFYLLDEIKYSEFLMTKYSCTKDELFNRYVTANNLRRHHNQALNQTHNMRKKMIRQLTKSNY